MVLEALDNATRKEKAVRGLTPEGKTKKSFRADKTICKLKSALQTFVKRKFSQIGWYKFNRERSINLIYNKYEKKKKKRTEDALGEKTLIYNKKRIERQKNATPRQLNEADPKPLCETENTPERKRSRRE